jgi:hypothetical protein
VRRIRSGSHALEHRQARASPRNVRRRIRGQVHRPYPRPRPAVTPPLLTSASSAAERIAFTDARPGRGRARAIVGANTARSLPNAGLVPAPCAARTTGGRSPRAITHAAVHAPHALGRAVGARVRHVARAPRRARRGKTCPLRRAAFGRAAAERSVVVRAQGMVVARTFVAVRRRRRRTIGSRRAPSRRHVPALASAARKHPAIRRDGVAVRAVDLEVDRVAACRHRERRRARTWRRRCPRGVLGSNVLDDPEIERHLAAAVRGRRRDASTARGEEREGENANHASILTQSFGTSSLSRTAVSAAVLLSVPPSNETSSVPVSGGTRLPEVS